MTNKLHKKVSLIESQRAKLNYTFAKDLANNEKMYGESVLNSWSVVDII